MTLLRTRRPTVSSIPTPFLSHATLTSSRRFMSARAHHSPLAKPRLTPQTTSAYGVSTRSVCSSASPDSVTSRGTSISEPEGMDVVPSPPPLPSPPDYPPHYNSMAKLRAFLSPHEVPYVRSIRDIRSRYTLWASKGVLGDLGAEDMSLLICLLGTLSINKHGEPIAGSYVHPRATEMPRNAFGSHWKMVSLIAGHKRWLKYPLLPSDHYWLFRLSVTRFEEEVKKGMRLSCVYWQDANGRLNRSN